jgi:hypothetical protein
MPVCDQKVSEKANRSAANAELRREGAWWKTVHLRDLQGEQRMRRMT